MEWMRLPSAPVIYPLGVRGDGLERVAARWQGEWSCRGELRRQCPDGLLLSVGLNDTARVGRPDGRPQLDDEAIRFAMGQLLAEMRGRCDVFVMGLTAVDDHVMPFAECLWYGNELIQSAECALADCCRDADIPFLALHERMLQNPGWLSWIEPDGIHLNADGHHWIHQQLRSWKPLMEWASLGSSNTSVPTTT
jgi:lysophospholipase L1-like esterase